MCIHGEQDISAAIKRFVDSQTYGVVFLQDKDGVPVQALDCVEFENRGDVSRAIGYLKSWHPDTLLAGGSISLSDVNRKRTNAGLAAFTVSDLPQWEGVVPSSTDRREAAHV